MSSSKAMIVALVLAFSYVPIRQVYSTLSFHLSSLPHPFSDPSFVSSSSFPASSSLSPLTLREDTIFGSRRDQATVNLSDYERLAFCEDAVVLEVEDADHGKRQLGLVSCDPTRWEWNTVMGTLVNPRAGKGSLWVVDPLRAEANRLELDWKNDTPTDSHPLGIDLLPQSKSYSPDTLFVINHSAAESNIELFHLRCSPPLDCSASHVQTLSHPSFTGAPNSIAVTSPTSFYLSHDHRFNLRTTNRLRKLLNSAETLLALPLSYVDHVSFSPSPSPDALTERIQVTRAVSNIAFANGIALSPSGKTLVVASTTSRSIQMYSRDNETNELTSKPYRIVKVPFLVDNLSTTTLDFFDGDDQGIPPGSTSGPASPVIKNPKKFELNSDRAETELTGEDDPFQLIATGHPSFFHLLATAHRSPPFSLASIITAPLSLFSPKLRRIVEGKSREGVLGGWEHDWRKTRGLSWSVLISNPPRASTSEFEWKNLYTSNGKGSADGNRGRGFGTSSTTILGKNWVDLDKDQGKGGIGETKRKGSWKRWMMVVGLYEEGVKVAIED